MGQELLHDYMPFMEQILFLQIVCTSLCTLLSYLLATRLRLLCAMCHSCTELSLIYLKQKKHEIIPNTNLAAAAAAAAAAADKFR